MPARVVKSDDDAGDGPKLLRMAAGNGRSCETDRPAGDQTG
jgi:hypothetical protein